MARGKSSRFGRGKLLSWSCVLHRASLRRGFQKKAGSPLSWLISSAVVFNVMFCMTGPVAAQTSPSLTTIPGLTPPEQATANAIATLCPPLARQRAARGSGAFTGAQNDLIDRCSEMVVNGQAGTNQSQTRDALLQASSAKIPTEGTTHVEAARVQIANIGARLAALRGGATGISLQGLAFNMHGQTLPGAMFASLLPGHEASDVADTYGPLTFPKFGTQMTAHTPPGVMLNDLSAQRGNGGTRTADNPYAFSKLGMFVNGTVSLGDRDTTSRETGFDFHTLGVTAGVDYRFTDHFILGTAFGFAATNADLNGTGGSLDTNQYSGSLYGTYYFDQLYLDGIVTIGHNTFDSKRAIIYSLPTPTGSSITNVSQTANGDTGGTHYSFGGGMGYDFRSGAWTFGPYGRLTYLKLDINGFGETIDNSNPGSGLALEYSDQTVESLRSSFGGQATYAISTQIGVLLPQLLFEWVHEFLNNQRTIAASFVNDPQHVPLNIVTDNPDRDFFNLGLGMSAVFSRGKAAFVYYQTALAFENMTKHDVVVGLRFEF